MTGEASARRILVTGASGFIGRRALEPLRRLGFEVHAAARHPESLHLTGSEGIHTHAVDLLQAGSTRTLLEEVRPSHLLHFAWYAEHGKFWSSPLNLEWLEATLSLLREFKAVGGRRFVGAGTGAEYEWSGVGHCDEATTPLRAATLYGTAKASAYTSGSAYAATENLSFAWGRIFHLFGPGEAEGRLVPALIRTHLQGGNMDCGPASHQRDFLSADSVADAFAALCASNVEGAVNIGSGEPLTYGELSETIAELAGSRGNIRFGKTRDPGPSIVVPNVQRLRREVNWKPRISLKDSLSESINWWKNKQ